MADPERISVAINQMIIELQKMELDLKCLKCLKILRSPLLLPCGHIFCCDCLGNNPNTSNCPACRLPYFWKDTIAAKHIENMIYIHNSMTHIVENNLTQRGNSFRTFETKIQSSENTISGSNDEVQENLEDKISVEKPSNTHSCAPFSWNLNTETSKIQTTKKYATKRLSIEALDKGCNDGREDNATKPKKQKANNQADSRINDGGNVVMKALKSHSEYENNSEDHPIAYQAGSSESISANLFYECEFCKLSEISLGTGLMLHILNGEQVKEDDASRSGVVHAHEKCVTWAPQIYFKGETVCNLKKELLRASKLNCYQCGKKGAALGCYVKSCRKSYHVPCAYGISECRWDCENYHVLCPAHRGRMLPCDESNEANELLHYADLSWNLIPATKQQVYESRASSSWENTNWILCGSALSDEEQVFLEKFAILSGSEVTSSWKENVTHVIASTNEHGACNRTMKYLISILTGKWILSINWLKACIKAGHPVAEEPYEISHDVHGVFYGPKTGRIRLAKKAPKLFAGLSFIFVGHINPVVKGFLENLVITGGGVLKSQNSSNYEDISPDLFVVYGVNSIEECEVDESRKRDAEAFAAKIGARAIPHCWILETVAACHLRM